MIRLRNTYHYYGFEAARLLDLGARGSCAWDVNPKLSLRAENGLAVRGSMDIPEWRNKIDELDEKIVQLLSERAAAAAEIGKLKAKNGAPIYEPQREQAVFEHVRRINPGPLSDAQVQDVYERLMDVMRSLQRQK
jgi:chorismate mutase